jgi:hypothetical protein
MMFDPYRIHLKVENSVKLFYLTSNDEGELSKYSWTTSALEEN